MHIIQNPIRNIFLGITLNATMPCSTICSFQNRWKYHRFGWFDRNYAFANLLPGIREEQLLCLRYCVRWSICTYCKKDCFDLSSLELWAILRIEASNNVVYCHFWGIMPNLLPVQHTLHSWIKIAVESILGRSSQKIWNIQRSPLVLFVSAIAECALNE